MTLTATEKASYRGDAGDTSSNDVTDAQLQAFYDQAVTFGEDADTTYAITMVYYLRRRLGLAINKIDVRGEVEGESRSQIFDHLKDVMLPYWEGLAGMSGTGTIGTGDLTLNLNFSESDLTNTWP